MFLRFLVLLVVFAESALALEGIRLPEGFQMRSFVDGVEGARSMRSTSDGFLFVGTRNTKVYAFQDSNNDLVIDKRWIISDKLVQPNGVALHDGDLFVAEIHRILKFPKIRDQLTKNKFHYEVVFDGYPNNTHHGWKFIGFGPDAQLYVPVGAPCNVCEEEDPFASITRLDVRKPDKFEIIARGVRNTVGFDWHPVTKNLWFTDNGRDWLGDDSPPDELNVLREPGQHFGFPYCHGGDIVDPEFKKPSACKSFVAPVMKLGPHVAALGMRFYRGEQFPPDYRGQIFIAEHGSWNRSRRIGYRVSLVRLDEKMKPVSYESFASGWLSAESVRGRPVDVENWRDGSLLVSDDFSGKIYRISYEGKK